MLKLPEIDYEFWLKNWSESVGLKPAYKNKNSILFLNHSLTINQCTKEIIKLTSTNNSDKEHVLKIIDLIYAWGGRSGRLFYASKKGDKIPRQVLGEDMSEFNTYLKGVELAKKGNAKSKDTFSKVYGIGSSYASKHAYFWSLDSNSPLIILDSKIAGSLGCKSLIELYKVTSYSAVISSFVLKSESVFNEKDPSKVERALFAFHDNYFKNDNSAWKKRPFKESSKDFLTAQRLSSLLFGELI